jgi:hypothetical protein
VYKKETVMIVLDGLTNDRTVMVCNKGGENTKVIFDTLGNKVATVLEPGAGVRVRRSKDGKILFGANKGNHNFN